MLVVETIAKIRRLSLVQRKSMKAICRELKVSRKVVRKVLRSGETEFRYERKHQPYPRMGAWRDELIPRNLFRVELELEKSLCRELGNAHEHSARRTQP